MCAGQAGARISRAEKGEKRMATRRHKKFQKGKRRGKAKRKEHKTPRHSAAEPQPKRITPQRHGDTEQRKARRNGKRHNAMGERRQDAKKICQITCRLAANGTSARTQAKRKPGRNAKGAEPDWPKRIDATSGGNADLRVKSLPKLHNFPR